MKWLLGLILSFGSLGAIADAIPLPACTINNQPVRYMSYKAEHLNAYDLQTWVAGSDVINGQPVISYNSTYLSTRPKEWNLQVMLHECAHLKIHALPKRRPPPNIKEYEADCHSAKILKSEYDYKDEEFDIIVNTMQEILPPDRIHAFNTCLNR
jgi:hypothetical protein